MRQYGRIIYLPIRDNVPYIEMKGRAGVAHAPSPGPHVLSAAHANANNGRNLPDARPSREDRVCGILVLYH